MALAALQGVGSEALGQWEEWTGAAYHVKRRLTAEEQRQVGPALDIRGTVEQLERHEAVRCYLPVGMKDWNE